MDGKDLIEEITRILDKEDIRCCDSNILTLLKKGNYSLELKERLTK